MDADGCSLFEQGQQHRGLDFACTVIKVVTYVLHAPTHFVNASTASKFLPPFNLPLMSEPTSFCSLVMPGIGYYNDVGCL